MYIYCICPYGKIKPNFIKIGSCTNINSLKKRYSTYYGLSHRSYYVKVDNNSFETIIHKKLKDMNLHIENELFIYNEIYDFYFYIQQLNELKNNKNDEDNKINNIFNKLSISSDESEDDYNFDYDKYYVEKQIHIFNFLKYLFKRKISNKDIYYNIKIYNGKFEYYQDSNFIVFHLDKKLWIYYLSFCDIQDEQFCKKKKKLKELIQSMVINVNEVVFKGYCFKFNNEYVEGAFSHYKITFEKYIENKYNLILNEKYRNDFENYIKTKDILLLKNIICKNDILKISKIDMI